MKKVYYYGILILIIVIMAVSVQGQEKPTITKQMEQLGITMSRASAPIFSGDLDQTLIFESKPGKTSVVYLISTSKFSAWKITKKIEVPVKQLNYILVNKDFTKAFVLCESGKIYACLDLKSGTFKKFYERKPKIENNFYPIPPFAGFFSSPEKVKLFGALYNKDGDEVGKRIAEINITKDGWEAFNIVCNIDELSKKLQAKYPKAEYKSVSFGKSGNYGFLYDIQGKTNLFIYRGDKKSFTKIVECDGILSYVIDTNGKNIVYLKSEGSSLSKKKTSLMIYSVDKGESKLIEEGMFFNPILSPNGNTVLVIKVIIDGNNLKYQLCRGEQSTGYKLKEIYKPSYPEIFYDFKSNGEDVFVIDKGEIVVIPKK